MADSALGHAASPTVAPAFRASTVAATRDNNAKAALTSTKTVTMAKSSSVRLLANNASLTGAGASSKTSVAGTTTMASTQSVSKKKKNNKNDAVLCTNKVTTKTVTSTCKTKAAAASSPRHVELIDLTSSPRAHSLVEKPISNRRLKREPEDFGYEEGDDQHRRANVSDEKKRRRSDRYDSSESSDRSVPHFFFSKHPLLFAFYYYLTRIQHKFLSVHRQANLSL